MRTWVSNNGGALWPAQLLRLLRTNPAPRGEAFNPGAIRRMRDQRAQTIVGFGACMSSGYPIGESASFLRLFVDSSLARPVTLRTVSLGGFTAPRAARFLRKRVIALQPDVLVLQFGTLDSSPPLREWYNSTARKLRPSRPPTPALEPQRSQDGTWLPYRSTARTAAKTTAKALLSLCLGLGPRVPRGAFVGTIAQMCRESRAAGAYVIVLSPFATTNWLQRFYAKQFAAATMVATEDLGCLFVDCLSTLSAADPSVTLLSDGYHLSAQGHRLVADLMSATWSARLQR